MDMQYEETNVLENQKQTKILESQDLERFICAMVPAFHGTQDKH